MRSQLSRCCLLPSTRPQHSGRRKPRQGGLLTPHGGLMFWTLVIFLVLFFILAKFAFKPITAAVEAREKALEDAIEAAKRDREEAARLLAEHARQLEAARGEAQKLIAEAARSARSCAPT